MKSRRGKEINSERRRVGERLGEAQKWWDRAYLYGKHREIERTHVKWRGRESSRFICARHSCKDISPTTRTERQTRQRDKHDRETNMTERQTRSCSPKKEFQAGFESSRTL